MEEQLIKFKTAKLAKEKGFDFRCNGFFNSGSGYKLQYDDLLRTGDGVVIEAPTQSLLSTWLKKTYGLYAYIDWVDDEVVIVDFKNSEGEELFRVNCYDFVPDYESEEELLEELLQKALKLIK